jgi:predicted acetyltransferase
MLEFRKALARAKAEWFDARYGNEHLNLMILATHPDHRRQGAASKLLAWGIQEAQTKKVSITLFSSPMGLPLYRKNGFEQVGLVHVQVEGEEEYIELPAMVLDPPSTA